jgi:hypothetical protein
MWLAGAPSTSVPAGFAVARGIAIGALGGCPAYTICGGNAAALAVCPFGWTPDSPERSPSIAAIMYVGRIWIAELVCPAASGAGSGSGLLAATLGAVPEGAGELALRAAGSLLAAGRAAAPSTSAAVAPCGAARISFSNVSMPAGVSGRGAASDDVAGDAAQHPMRGPAAAPLAATSPASNSGNMPSPAAPVAGVWSAVSRDEAPGVDTLTFCARSEGGRPRAATRRKLQLEGQTGAGAFSRSWAEVARQRIATARYPANSCRRPQASSSFSSARFAVL